MCLYKYNHFSNLNIETAAGVPFFGHLKRFTPFFAAGVPDFRTPSTVHPQWSPSCFLHVLLVSSRFQRPKLRTPGTFYPLFRSQCPCFPDTGNTLVEGLVGAEWWGAPAVWGGNRRSGGNACTGGARSGGRRCVGRRCGCGWISRRWLWKMALMTLMLRLGPSERWGGIATVGE